MATADELNAPHAHWGTYSGAPAAATTKNQLTEIRAPERLNGLYTREREGETRKSNTNTHPDAPSEPEYSPN